MRYQAISVLGEAVAGRALIAALIAFVGLFVFCKLCQSNKLPKFMSFCDAADSGDSQSSKDQPKPDNA
jgi:hypothetical protein